MDGPNIRFMFGTRYVRLVYRIFVFSRLFGKMSNLLDKLISKYLLLKIDLDLEFPFRYASFSGYLMIASDDWCFLAFRPQMSDAIIGQEERGGRRMGNLRGAKHAPTCCFAIHDIARQILPNNLAEYSVR